VPVVLALLPAACATGPRRPVALAVGDAVDGGPWGAYDSAMDTSVPHVPAVACGVARLDLGLAGAPR